MIRLIVGLKGSGKTKQLIELTNKAVETSPGHVVCIEKGDKLKYDIRREVRLIDTDEYNIADAKELFGMVAGVLAADYDVKDVFIDSSLKICKEDKAGFVELIKRLDELTKKYEINCVSTASINLKDLPEELTGYIF